MIMIILVYEGDVEFGPNWSNDENKEAKNYKLKI